VAFTLSLTRSRFSSSLSGDGLCYGFAISCEMER